ncbi:MAG: zinc ribbon domain-containing protein [Flavobacteriales bacterium]|nr:zinc ribbon domain-containing protein [Flavobacteriales bacterium]
MALIKCKECGHKISKKAATCPSCGATNKKKRRPTSFLTGLIAIIIIGWIGSTITDNQYKTKQATTERIQKQQGSTYFKNNKNTIISDIQKKINVKQYQQALLQINKYQHVNSPEINKLNATVKEQITLTKLKSLPAKKYHENLKLYNQLISLKPNNIKYKNKVTYYQNKVNAEEINIASRKLLYGAKPIKDHWTNGYIEIEKHLQHAAHDPSSIQFDNCSDVFFNENKGWLIRCTYRGKNAYGALIKNTNWFTVKHSTVTQQHRANAYKI